MKRFGLKSGGISLAGYVAAVLLTLFHSHPDHANPEWVAHEHTGDCAISVPDCDEIDRYKSLQKLALSSPGEPCNGYPEVGYIQACAAVKNADIPHGFARGPPSFPLYS